MAAAAEDEVTEHLLSTLKREMILVRDDDNDADASKDAECIRLLKTKEGGGDDIDSAPLNIGFRRGEGEEGGGERLADDERAIGQRIRALIYG